MSTPNIGPGPVTVLDDADATPRHADSTLDNPYPTQTPNVVISNPVVRKTVNTVLSIGAVATSVAGIVDAAIPQIDISAFTAPAAVIILGIAGVFNLAVTLPNTPTK